MRLTRFTDNAIRGLIVLGLEPERAIPVNEVALRMNMSYEHLVKIVQRLTELGYVRTVRGRHGGVQLAKAPQDLLLGDLVRRLEENLAIVECFSPETNTCPIAPACALAGVFEDALRAFLAVLDQRTLADVLTPRNQLIRLMRAHFDAPE